MLIAVAGWKKNEMNLELNVWARAVSNIIRTFVEEFYYFQ